MSAICTVLWTNTVDLFVKEIWNGYSGCLCVALNNILRIF